MTKEKLQEYIETLEIGNRGYQAIMHHPLAQKIKDSENLRYWLPEQEKPEVESEDFSEFEYLWTTNRIAKNIAAFLRLNGFTVDFKTSTVSKDGGKNNQKVGRILNVLNPKLLESWKKLTNKSFSTKNTGGKQWVISANPIDIAGSSYKRKWTSCTGDGHHMVRMTNGAFSFIAYLCDKTDTNISNPHCRYFIHIGMPTTATTATTNKNVRFDLTGKNVPPGHRTLTLTIPESGNVLGNIGALFIDTKYGNCSGAEFRQLSDFIQECNDTSLNINKLKTMNIRITGLYVNSYTLPYSISLSTKSTKPVIKKSKTVKVVDTLADRAKNYRRHSNRPSYELVEYVINNAYFSNQNLNNAIFQNPELSKYVSVDVIDAKITQSKEKVDIDKKKIAELSDYNEIVKITQDIEICINSVNSLQKIKSDITTAIDKASKSKKTIKV